jgi:hypothetical protein
VVTLAGLMVEVPAVPAAPWLSILMADEIELEDILPGLLEPLQAEQIEDALLNGSLSLVVLHETVLDILSTVCGRTWYVAIKIISTAKASWNVIGGEFVRRNIDASAISIAAWLDAAYHLLLQAMSTNDANIFNAKLQVPPPGFEMEEEEPTLSAESFMSMNLG